MPENRIELPRMLLEMSMSKSLSKLLIIMTILIAFVGQAIAYHFMDVYDAHSNLQSTAQLQINDYYGVKSSENDDDCCEIECCESECICPANACISPVFLDTKLSLSELVILSESMLSLQSKDTHFIASSLYRPPIFTS